ncbi:hypothetical protein QYE76_027544 [Lolium multiflorum]|uniref:Reverse transcriptase domain-containing protein n=1 Tax=Lolium multiflorum TaxID=4521 RepID=A0AAD8QJB1_LOLMU|nr:hypothetical protein QYE76_027544 [Lolium multiflorum]
MGWMVSTNQSAFIKGQCLHDNFVLVREVARRINQKRQIGVLVKLDISHAFDSISWAFLLQVLRHLGFGVLFLKWVSLFLFTTSTKVSDNGVPGERIQHACGLRQVDPTSPLLYVIGMEVLTCMIVKAVEQHLFSHLVGIITMHRISVYADDLVLFVKENESEPRVVKEILKLFKEASDLEVNNSKTTAMVIRGNEESRTRVQETLQWFRWGIGVCIATWLMGPRTVRVVAEAQPPAAAAAAQTSPPPPVDGACHLHKQALDDCLNHEGSDISKCQFYMDLLNECRRKSNSAAAVASPPVPTS